MLDGLQVDFPNWIQAGDEDLVKIGNQWWMFFTSINTKEARLHTLAATLPAGAPLDSPASAWKIVRKNGAIAPVISPSDNPADWDSNSIETVQYVYGYDSTARKWVERIYYLGWPKTTAAHFAYKIGYAQKNNTGKWVKRGVVISPVESYEKYNGTGIIGDHAVIYQPGTGRNGANGIWHMWYQAASNIGVSLVYTTSRDGVNWSAKKRLTHKSPFPDFVHTTGPYHLDVMYKNGKYYFVGFVASTTDLANQGIWMVTSTTPDGSRPGDFTDWKPLVYEASADWHYSGPVGSKCHSTGNFAATLAEENGKTFLFYDGVRSEYKASDPCTDRSSNVGSIGRVSLTLP